jgi:molybdate transport system ATP-binding protein
LIKIKIKKPLYGVVENMLLDINLEIKKGEFVAIKGKSGSGKTTFLRILAGLEEAEGEIKVNNEVWLNDKINLPPQKRKIGFLFQDYALFENMRVEENLLFVSSDKSLANRLLEVTELIAIKNRYPKTLSGGQKQRVSLCRALMKRPEILLLDEPFSSLDLEMRLNLQNEILKLHKEFNITTIMISHDLSEIYKLANRIIELKNGTIISDLSKENLVNNKLFLDAEVLEVNKSSAIVSIGQQIIEIKNRNYNKNSFIKLQINSNIL